MLQRTTDHWQLRTLAKILTAVPGGLVGAEAQQVSSQLIAMMEQTTDLGELAVLAEVLEAVPGGLGGAKAQQVSTLLIAAFERTTNPVQLRERTTNPRQSLAQTTDPSQLRALAEGLKAVAGGLSGAEAQQVSAQLFAAMAWTTNLGELETLAETLKEVSIILSPQQVIDLMKWPTSVAHLRSTLLEVLERQKAQKLDRSLWKMVTWAETNGFDVKSRPKRPGR